MPLHNILPSPIDVPKRVDGFRAQVDMAGDKECWEWQGTRSASGYGVMYLGKSGGRPITGRWSNLAHRMAYSLWVRPIPKGLVIDHLCKNRACCNPRHLEAVTQGVNAMRSNPAKTHCPRGHALTGDNLYTSRRCRTCVRARQLAAYQAKKEA